MRFMTEEKYKELLQVARDNCDSGELEYKIAQGMHIVLSSLLSTETKESDEDDTK
jgi:hypothetical protein